MATYALRRTGAALLALILASMLIFAGTRAMPGDPARVLAGEERDPVVLAAIREKYALDQPIPVQYWRWATLALQGDLGRSARTGLEVRAIVFSRLPITIELALYSMLVAILIGIPTGIIAAVRRGKPADYAGNAFGLFGLSVPNFWLGLMLILLFAINLRWLPASGYVPFTESPLGHLQRMVLPAIVLGTGLSAVLMRQMRSSMLETFDADYIRTARAKGLSEWAVIGVHALRNSLITVVTVVGLQLGMLISGAVVTERIFVIPGFGRLIIDGVFTRDFPVVQAVALVSAAGYILVNLAVDLVYSLLNPRIRVSGRPA